MLGVDELAAKAILELLGMGALKYGRYLALGREAERTGDDVEIENFYQHAEHYLRVMKGGGDERRD